MTVAELRAIGRCLLDADGDRRVTRFERLVELADDHPDDAAAVLAVLPTAIVPAEVRDGVVAAWVRGGAPDRFRTTWAALRSLASQEDDAVVSAVLAQLKATRPGPGFAFGAVTFLEERLAATDRPPATHERDLELLEQVLPPGHRRRIGVWQAFLGDAAAAAGRPEEAHRRWGHAVAARVAGASPRLARSYALKGRQAVLSGDPGTGAECYAKAFRLTGHREYRLGELVARVLDGHGDAAELEQLGTDDSEVALWAGIAHVVAGDLAAGGALLLKAGDWPKVARLLQQVEIGVGGPVAMARKLLDEHGDDWTVHTPVPSDRVVDAVAGSADVELLEQLLRGCGLLAGYPERARLNSASRERAAHAVLTAAMHQDADVVLTRLELAERLLAEDAS